MKPSFFRVTLACIRSTLLGTALVAASAASPAVADTFPNHAVRILVAFPPGGATDTIAREVAHELQKIWDESVVVDNRPGAAGMIATSEAARAKPDGYTLLLATDGAMVAIPFLVKNVPYDPLTDLTPIALVGGIPLVLVANEALGADTLEEFVAAAKANPNGIDYASSGIGASHHLSMERLQQETGIKLHHIAYKGGAPALQAVLAGEVPVSWVAVSTALPHLKAGKIKALAIGSLERSPLLPDVPTVDELGHPGFEAGNWVGIIGPKGLPQELVQKIQLALQKVVQSPTFRERMLSQGSEVRTATSAEFASRIKQDYDRNKALFLAAGIEKN